MNTYEDSAVYNIAETCAYQLKVLKLLRLAVEAEDFWYRMQ